MRRICRKVISHWQFLKKIILDVHGVEGWPCERGSIIYEDATMWVAWSLSPLEVNHLIPVWNIKYLRNIAELWGIFSCICCENSVFVHHISSRFHNPFATDHQALNMTKVTGFSGDVCFSVLTPFIRSIKHAVLVAGCACDLHSSVSHRPLASL